MSKQGLEAFDRTLQLTHRWLDDLMGELRTDSRPRAWHALSVVLHAIRDRLPIAEAAHLSAQLPMLVRGMFFEGWRPEPVRQPRRSFERDLEAAFQDWWPDGPERTTEAVLRVLSRHVSAGEIADVMHVLPGDARQIWERATR
jgi:uncharacterized protein (DUF2267 family)